MRLALNDASLVRSGPTSCGAQAFAHDPERSSKTCASRPGNSDAGAVRLLTINQSRQSSNFITLGLARGFAFYTGCDRTGDKKEWSMIVGSGDYRYRVKAGWAKLPDGWSFKEVGGIGVDSNDHVYVFNRGVHPMMVFD